MLSLEPLTKAAKKVGALEGRIGFLVGEHIVLSGSVKPGDGSAPCSLTAKVFGPYPQVFLGQMLDAARSTGTTPVVVLIDTAPSGTYLRLERGLAYCGEEGNEPLEFSQYRKIEANYVLSIGSAYRPDNQNCIAWKVEWRETEGEYVAEQGKEAAPRSPKDFSDPCVSDG
ncbi:hypothetical protein HYV82_00475 [Candidatus Woesearchaeota archaeon]|nr:hypothetical protein [Candidatus Woesearchaeota archaeon]